ncbi:hypothetical protein [Aquimarina longa]|uniref:hypothetical protein n=1 Tax=Aquimarina longa TaxID=1080221 RepID=UPI0007861816|nr:hypothetical protein [Aquimarina longa]
MILTALPYSELKTILKTRKEKFNSYRIVQGKIYEKVEYVSEIIEKITKKESKSVLENNNNSNLDNHVSSEDTTKATKTYSEKIKGGYFGKRRSRF